MVKGTSWIGGRVGSSTRRAVRRVLLKACFLPIGRGLPLPLSRPLHSDWAAVTNRAQKRLVRKPLQRKVHPVQPKYPTEVSLSSTSIRRPACHSSQASLSILHR